MRDEIHTDASRLYQSGFANEFASEALPGALPIGRNSPQRPAYGLYAEQLSGTAFTAPRAQNRRSWLYRIRPAVVHRPFVPLPQHATRPLVAHFTAHVSGHASADATKVANVPATPPNPLRWNPLPLPTRPTDFIDGWVTMAGTGAADAMQGCAIHLYAANISMHRRYFYSADGELLIVPQLGGLAIRTEFGIMDVAPQEMAVVPRGVRFSVDLPDGPVRGYVCENFGALLRLPDLGPIGSNGLANPRDFLTPKAAYQDLQGDFELVAKLNGALWSAAIDHSPLDVVAWHGNYVPYKYDLRRFNTIGSASYDHPDPSISLVLQSPSDTPGVDTLDFVVFPPRWLTAEDTFRPPWFHRNVASEFMGLIHGVYDAKAEGFIPGGASLHNCMTGHGPDAETFEKASAADTSVPTKVRDTMAFMFETRTLLRPTRFALECAELQRDYATCWEGLAPRFDPERP